MAHKGPGPQRQLAIQPMPAHQTQRKLPIRSKFSISTNAEDKHQAAAAAFGSRCPTFEDGQDSRASPAFERRLDTKTSSHFELEGNCIDGLVLPAHRHRSRKISPNFSTDGTDCCFSSRRSWCSFQECMSRLPSEICTMIMDFTLKLIFGPGKIYTKINSPIHPIMKMFLALNRTLYHEYREVYWSKNTWVVDQGPANHSMRFMTMAPFSASTTEFSKQIPNEAALRIRRIELSCSTEDLQFSQMAQGKVVHSIDHDGVRQENETNVKGSESDLMQIWQDKFDRIAFLKLDFLVLDFRMAHALDGNFLGASAAQRMMCFVYGIPKEFHIMAPSKPQEDEIRNIFLQMNRSKPVLTGS